MYVVFAVDHAASRASCVSQVDSRILTVSPFCPASKIHHLGCACPHSQSEVGLL